MKLPKIAGRGIEALIAALDRDGVGPYTPEGTRRIAEYLSTPNELHKCRKCRCKLVEFEVLNSALCCPCRDSEMRELRAKTREPRFEDLFEMGTDGIARRRVGAVGQSIEAKALMSIPAAYAHCTRSTWRGAWPLPASLDQWPMASPDGAPAPWVVVMLGPTGTGKTHSATAFFREAVARFSSGGVFQDCAGLLVTVKAGFQGNAKPPEETAAFSPRILLLDDVGAERGTDFDSSFLSNVLRHRHAQNYPTIVTTNARTLSDLEGAIDRRVLSRFAEGVTVELAGRDKRIHGEAA